MQGSPNVLAYAALFLCPLVSIATVALLRAQLACPLIIIGAQLFLPPVLDIAVPGPKIFNKDILPALSALVGCLIFRRRLFRGSRPGRGYDLFILLMVAGSVGTMLTNRDPVFAGPLVLPPFGLHDIAAQGVQTVLYWWPPFYLGRTIYRRSRDLRDLFVVLVVAGLVYAPLLAFEMRVSPQLNRWVYGFHAGEFAQTLRGGGFRPMVFMRHGLTAALFLVFAVFAATALARARQRVLGLNAGVVAAFLLVVLVLSRSAGALVYTVAFAPFILFAPLEIEVRWAAIAAAIVFSYPVCRAAGLVPIDHINGWALEIFGTERAGSLAYRLSQERLVMERALERLVFGWGGYGRGFPRNPYNGEYLASTDGLWAITISTSGIVGYVGLFGLLLAPILAARRALARVTSTRDRILVAALASMSATYLLDLIPNAGIDPYLTFLVGVLAGARRGFEQGAPGDATTARAAGAHATSPST